MSIQVIGAGLGRTGTLSLKAALEELGFAKCYHPLEVFASMDQARTWDAAARGEPVDWDRLFAGYRATVDLPGCMFYRELLAKYPEAKVILTVRDPERWYDSVRQTIHLLGNTFPKWTVLLLSPRMRVLQRMLDRLRDRMFRGRFEDRAFAIEVFNRHNEQVRRDVPADRLLAMRSARAGARSARSSRCPSPRGSRSRTSTTPPRSAPRSTAMPSSRGPSAMPPSAWLRWCFLSSSRWWRSGSGPEPKEPISAIGWRRVDIDHRAGPHVCGRCPPDEIAFHNDERLHQSLAYRTPPAVYRGAGITER
jgi:hypothetical protein